MDMPRTSSTAESGPVLTTGYHAPRPRQHPTPSRIRAHRRPLTVSVGRLIGPAALAAVSTAGFYVWVLLSLGEMVEVGLIAVAARRHGEGRPDLAARAAGAAVGYAPIGRAQ